MINAVITLINGLINWVTGRILVAPKIPGQESEGLLRAMLDLWIYTFGPPGRVVMDQQVSLMGPEAGGEFERLNIKRCPRGTKAGHGSEQHTGTWIVERHVQLMKMTMYKLRAELQRQGLDPSMEELAQEFAMAHNITLNYKGVTPSMAVFGTLHVASTKSTLTRSSIQLEHCRLTSRSSRERSGSGKQHLRKLNKPTL